MKTETKQIKRVNLPRLVSEKEEERMLLENDILTWAGLNIGNAVALAAESWLEGAISNMNKVNIHDEQIKSVRTWAGRLSKNIDTLNLVLSGFYKTKIVQIMAAGNICYLLQEVISVLLGVTPEGELIGPDLSKYELVLIPRDKAKNIRKYKDVQFYSDKIKALIKEQNDQMVKEGKDPNPSSPILDRMKKEHGL